MPTYEYACTNCGQHVEVFQRVAEPPLETCAACGGHMRKVFFPAGIVFKGSGFYATDSRSKSTTSASSDAGSGSESKKAPASADGGSKAKSGTKADAKPAAKPATNEKSA